METMISIEALAKARIEASISGNMLTCATLDHASAERNQKAEYWQIIDKLTADGCSDANLVAEFWNAKESYSFATNNGHSVDTEKAVQRMKLAIKSLEIRGFFKTHTERGRYRMPTNDEMDALA